MIDQAIQHRTAGNHKDFLISIARLAHVQNESNDINCPPNNEKDSKEYLSNNQPQYMRALGQVCEKVLTLDSDEEGIKYSKIKFLFLRLYLKYSPKRSADYPVFLEIAVKVVKDFVKQKQHDDFIQYLHNNEPELITNFANEFKEKIDFKTKDWLAVLPEEKSEEQQYPLASNKNFLIN